MPELPEVETVRRGLAPVLEQKQIATLEQRRPDLRFPFPDRFADRLTGAQVILLGRRAKYLTAQLSTGEMLIMHLGMSGSFRVDRGQHAQTPGAFHHERNAVATHDHVVFHMKDGERITYNDPRRFGFMLLTPTDQLDAHPLIAGLGIEPLGNELAGDFLNRAFAGKSTSLKAALMDQRIIAGLGNIYVCEALHRAGLSPRRKASSVTRKKGVPDSLEKLARAIRDVLDEAIAAGGSSLRDHRQTSGELGYFQHAFRVYDRDGAPCPTPGCSGTVRRIVQQGRSTFYCSKCQR